MAVVFPRYILEIKPWRNVLQQKTSSHSVLEINAAKGKYGAFYLKWRVLYI